jgi:transcriptional regulator with XRE-family HTH domain
MAKLMVTAVDQSIGRRIQLRRRELELTAAELSEQLGISQQQLSRYERGTNKINVSHLVNIAVLLETPIGWFFLDCQADVPGAIKDGRPRYAVNGDEGLKVRLEQHWERLDHEQRRTLLAFLDATVSV